MIEFPNGSVWLVGAGPGDPDLLTRKAERLICTADVIFHDALVGPAILDLARRATRLVNVGKRSGRHSKDQRTINALIVEAALAGHRVVRLKGGDPAIFARANEELEACGAAKVRVSICPGITAASAAVASLGRTLTARGLARKLVFVSAHVRQGEELMIDWPSLADPTATLAIYMGKSAAPMVERELLAAGMAGDTPVTLVENASLPNERSFDTRIDLLALAARTSLGSGPALILIGQAMARTDIPTGRLALPAVQPQLTEAHL